MAPRDLGRENFCIGVAPSQSSDLGGPLGIGCHRAARVRLRVVSAAFATVASLTACGGGGGSDSSNPPPAAPPPPPAPSPAPAPAAFTIQSTVPADGSTGASRTGGFAATLSVAASAPTVTSSSITLRGPEGNVLAAKVASSGTALMVTPATGALPGDTTYTVTFAPTIEDITGRAISGTLTKAFTTSSQIWRPTVTDVANVPDLTNLGQPSVAYDAAGNLLVAWHVFGPANHTLYVARLNVATDTWSAPTALETVVNGGIAGLSLTCGTTGDCYLAWTRSQSGTYRTPRTARFDSATSTWGILPDPPVITTIEDVTSVRPVMDKLGNLTLLATTGAQMVAMPFNAATQTWSPQNVYTFGARAGQVRVAMDPLGNISAAWVHQGPSSAWVYGNHYDAGTGVWSAEQPIDDMLDTSLAGSLWLTLDGTNAATVVFARGALPSTIYASRLSPATGLWGASTRLDNNNPNANTAYHPQVTGDAAGYVTAVWNQPGGLWSSRFSPVTSAWTSPVALSATAGATGGTSLTSLAVDIAGNVTATWSTDFGVAASRWLVKSGTWGPVTDISVPSAGSLVFTSRMIETTAGATGDVATAWYQRSNVNGAQQYKLVVNTLD